MSSKGLSPREEREKYAVMSDEKLRGVVDKYSKKADEGSLSMEDLRESSTARSVLTDRIIDKSRSSPLFKEEG